VVIGFTNGIAVLIMLSQVKDFLGLTLDKVPASFFAQLQALGGALHTVNPMALALALGSLVLVALWQRLMPRLGPDKLPFSGKLTVVPGTIVALA
ncbi:SulP family inorganic anion transporter, partial [Salmonella enterica subsp. enterica]